MTYPGIPTHVVIGGVEYRVILDGAIKPNPDRQSPANEEYSEDGEFDAAQQEIRIAPGMALDYARHILTHESLHGMWEHAGMTAAGGPLGPHEEMVVTGLARRLCEFLRANPAFVAFITGAP